MCSFCMSRRTTAAASFSAEQFSASTRSAALLLAIFFLLAALSILFAPTVEGQIGHIRAARTAASQSPTIDSPGRMGRVRGSTPR